MAKVTGVVNESKRSGEKNGKHWNIMTVEVDSEGTTIVADSFDKLQVGSEVLLTYNDEYKQYNAKLASGNSGKTFDKLVEIETKIDKIIALLDKEPLDIPEFEA